MYGSVFVKRWSAVQIVTRHHKINGLGSKHTRLDIASLVSSMRAPILPTGIPEQAFNPPLDV